MATLYNVGFHHYSLLIGHMLKTDAVCRDACTNLESEWFTMPDVGGDFWHSLAFTTIKQFWDDYHSRMDEAAFQIGIYDLAKRFIAPGTPFVSQFAQQTNQFVTGFLPTVQPTSRPLAVEVYRHLINKCRFDVEMQSLLHEASQIGAAGVGGGGDVLAGLGQKLMDVEKRRASSLDGISESGIMGQMDTHPRTKTGVDFLDARLGNGKGPTRHSVMGIIIPQGGGKTTLGNQIAVSQALMGRPSLIVIAEQGFDAAYRRNIWAMATGVPTPIFEDNNDDPVAAAKAAGIPPDTVMARLEQVDKNLRWVDLIKRNGDVAAFEDEVVRLSESSTERPLEVVYIDWATAMARMMVGRGYRDQRFKDPYEALGVLSDRVAEIAANHSLFVAFSQQMAGQAAKGSPYAEHNEYCALDNTLWTAPFRYCMVVNKKCPKTKLQIAGMPKARNDPTYLGTDRFVLKLDGPKARFDEATDFEVKPGRIVSKKFNGDRSSVPKE